MSELIVLHQRLLTLLGMTTVMLEDLKPYIPDDKKKGIDWFNHAIEEVVYHDKPIPEFNKDISWKSTDLI